VGVESSKYKKFCLIVLNASDKSKGKISLWFQIEKTVYLFIYSLLLCVLQGKEHVSLVPSPCP
jgi:hypothetical protein